MFTHDLKLTFLVQGCSQQAPVAQSRQQAKLDAHAQKLRQGVTSSNPAASSPLAAVLSDLSYQPWQLQATLPQTPKVHFATSLVQNGHEIQSCSIRLVLLLGFGTYVDNDLTIEGLPLWKDSFL